MGAYNIDGDTVYYEDARAYQAVTPHTISRSGWTTNILKSKTYTGYINTALCFDTTVVNPKKAQLYNPHNITRSRTCGEGYFYNYTYNPNHAWCWQNITIDGNGTRYNQTNLIWEHDFQWADPKTATIFWNETEEWRTIGRRFNIIHTNLDAKDTCYYLENIPITAGQTYTFRLYLEVPKCLIGDCPSGKYDWVVWPSSYGHHILEAWHDGHLYLLDPWWSAETSEYRRRIYNGTTGIPLLINSSNSYTGSDLDNDETTEWCYFAQENNSYIYYNTTTFLINGVANTSEVFWFCSNDSTGINWGTANTDKTPSGLGRYFPFDEYGSIAYDFANGLNASVVGGIARVSGKIHNAYNFSGEGSGEYVNIGKLRAGSRDAISISVWLKPLALASDNKILDDWTGSGNLRAVQLLVAGDGHIHFYVADSSGIQVFDMISTSTISTGNWHHIVATWDSNGDGKGRIYINGTLDATSTEYSNEPYKQTNQDCWIGASGAGSRAEFGGQMDDFQIYNRSLTQTEITALYEQGAYLGEAISSLVSMKIEWDWADINSTTSYNSTTVAWNTSITATECNLTVNGTVYTNTTVGTSFSQNLTNYGDGNWTLYINCSDSSGNLANSTIAWWYVDATPPTISWGDWKGKNASTTYNSTTINITASENVNCTLYFNGTAYPNSTIGTYVSWNLTNIPDGNYSIINATCEDSLGNKGTTTNAWWYVDSSGPTCSFINVTPTDIEANSTGIFIAILNCTDASGINTSRFIMTRTLSESGSHVAKHYRPPDNDKGDFDATYNEHILRADGRNDGKWYENLSLFSNNYTYAAQDNTSIRVTIHSGPGYATYNFTWRVEPSVFESMVFLSRGHLEKEDKTGQEQLVYNNHPLLVKLWNFHSGEGNYTFTIFLNGNYTDNPNKNLNVYFCNDSYDPTGGISPLADTTNCAYLDTLTEAIFDDARDYISRNSSYVRRTFSAINNSVKGIYASNYIYLFYQSDTASASKAYTIRFANGTSGTNITFKDSKVAWNSTDEGATWSQADFTPDIWMAQEHSGHAFVMGVYVEDKLGNNLTDLSLYSDDIGDVDWPILNPAILYYTSNTSAVDYDLDGTYNREMRIRVGVSIDPDAVGNVNHTLYLINASDDSVVKVIKANFTSANDSDVDVWFNTTDVPDYDRYTFKVVATCANDSTDTQSFQANSNFTIRNELGVGSISEANITLICPSDKQEIETDFTISWVVSVSGSVNNYISNVSEPSGCWYVSGADNDTNTTLGGTITNSSTYQCGAIATYTFALNITYTNATGTYTINKTCNITTKSKTGSGGGSPTTPTAEVNFTLIPDVLLPRNSQTMFQQQRADFSLTVRNYKDAFLGKIIFELVPTDELGQNEFATDGWCELVDTFYQNYIYPENSTTTNINIKCELPQFDWGKEQAWYEKVCVKADNGEKKCSLLKISSKKADREVETDLIERILELLSVYWFPVILLISLLIVVIWYGKRKKRKK